MKEKKIQIDLVYLWVDGSDKKWLAKKNFWLEKYGKSKNKYSNVDARFRDNDELKYSLRSVEKFAPWINRIFVVTGGQTPSWLKKSKKISIVDHSKMMPKDALPTFNSTAIETCLHKIPNLSEHFLFANDDMFFNDYITPEYFFDTFGNPIVNVKRKRLSNDSFNGDGYEKYWGARHGYNKALHKARGIIYTAFLKKYFIEPAHNIDPMRKSYLKDTVKKFNDIFKADMYFRFRDKDETGRFLYPLYDNCMGRNTLVLNNNLTDIRREYDFKRTDGFMYFIKKLFVKEKIESFDGADIRKKILKHKPKLFCINDGPRSGKKTLEANKKFLQKMFSKKSEFEK